LGDAAEHCEPVDLRFGVLEVAVDSSVWAQHLQMRRGEILRSLADAMGEGAPTDLRFRVR
jgi:predicted nucleic acid-binding Zn ribbon protein